MKQIAWTEGHRLGIDSIDREHKQLFLTMNKLLRIIEEEDKSEWACREGVKFLKNHSLEHFEHEEAYMKSIGYRDYEIHKRLHDDFKDKTLPALERELEEMEYSVESIRHFLSVCIGWVFSHTLTEDLAIVGKRTSRWLDISQEQEREAVEQAVLQNIQNLFHLDARIISEQYDGENFGKTVCCRFLFRGQGKEKWEVILVYEEMLLFKIVGGILNVEFTKLDDMVINICRYLSRQFLEAVRECFPALMTYELDKESLLTHEQLIQSFEREQPYCSLLFDSGAGYFAFCAMNANSVYGKTESSIDHENAIDMVNQYLLMEKKEWAKQKKKILVVDDSDFVRVAMTKLLQDDYSVLTAESSISAIQSIVLNRPDLILLDYDMPVCDGRQTLEMIRSEKTIADIPVIFLTGRGDRESVKKVMVLKPEGYLLKTMAEKDIKKTIDDFFEKKDSV